MKGLPYKISQLVYFKYSILTNHGHIINFTPTTTLEEEEGDLFMTQWSVVRKLGKPMTLLLWVYSCIDINYHSYVLFPFFYPVIYSQLN